MEVSNNKTQRVKVTQYNPLPAQHKKKQEDSKRETMDVSNIFNENILKEIFLKFL